MKRILAALATIIALSFMTALPANAATADDDLQTQIDQIMAEHPGGTQIGPNAVEWEGGAVTLTLAVESPHAVAAKAIGSCASGSYCIYNNTSLGGSKVAFTTCNKTYSTSVLPGTVKSIANARSTGTVTAHNSSGSTLSTIKAGASVAVEPGNISAVKCAS